MDKGKLNIPMIAALSLLCLTLISVHFTSGLYARYSISDTASDDAKVAVFKIETELDYVTLGMDEGNKPSFQLGGAEGVSSVQIPFYIENQSEVAVIYSAEVNFGVNVPEYLSLTLSDGSNSQTISADGGKSSFSFTEFGTMEAGAAAVQRVNLTLTISVSNLAEITAEVSIPTAELIVKVYQID